VLEYRFEQSNIDCAVFVVPQWCRTSVGYPVVLLLTWLQNPV
jgi:hypothetical protein